MNDTIWSSSHASLQGLACPIVQRCCVAICFDAQGMNSKIMLYEGDKAAVAELDPVRESVIGNDIYYNREVDA